MVTDLFVDQVRARPAAVAVSCIVREGGPTSPEFAAWSQSPDGTSN
jgi:hypothetical protein